VNKVYAQPTPNGYHQKTLASGQVVTLIPANELPRYIGQLVHLSWARNKGFVWRLKAINADGTISLVTPKTNKPLRAYAHEACFVNDFDPTLLNSHPLPETKNCNSCNQPYKVYYSEQHHCKRCLRNTRKKPVESLT
jgi:hypothetical protein